MESCRAATDPSRLKFHQDVPGKGWSCSRGNGHSDAELPRFIDQLEEVPTGERVAAGQDQLR